MFQFKLATLSLDDFSDTEIKNIFLNLEITNENDIREAVGIISTHRPEIFRKYH